MLSYMQSNWGCRKRGSTIIARRLCHLKILPPASRSCSGSALQGREDGVGVPRHTAACSIPQSWPPLAMRSNPCPGRRLTTTHRTQHASPGMLTAASKHPARAAGPKARVGVEVVVPSAETVGAEFCQPDGASIHTDAGCTEDAEYRKGKVHITPCWMVHPREMRAMKVPTSGAQAIHRGALAVVRPLLSQSRLGKGFDVEGNRDDLVELVTDRPDDQVEDVPGLIQCKPKHHHRAAAHQGVVRHCLDSQLQTCHGRKLGTDRDDGWVTVPSSRLLANSNPRKAIHGVLGARNMR